MSIREAGEKVFFVSLDEFLRFRDTALPLGVMGTAKPLLCFLRSGSRIGSLYELVRLTK